MFACMHRFVFKAAVAAFAISLLTGCGSFAIKYQNYFTKNLAYYASQYDGDPSRELSAGAESNNIVDGNEETYSAAKVPQVIAGFRNLEYQNTNYHKGNQFDFAFAAYMVAPGKTEADAIQVATFDLTGKNFSAQKQLPEAAQVVIIKMSYPAVMIYLNNKALQAKYGSGTYTMIWRATREDGKTATRELSRVTTNLTP